MAHEMTGRGSDHIFSFEEGDSRAMSDAVSAARLNYEVRWWWKYGKPAFIDLIKADIVIPKERFGEVLSQFMGMNGPERMVTAECFPLGLIDVDSYRVDLQVRRPIGR